MTVVPNQNFHHGTTTFIEGQEHEVSEVDAEYFATSGWVGQPKPQTAQTLDIQDITLGHESGVQLNG